MWEWMCGQARVGVCLVWRWANLVMLSSGTCLIRPVVPVVDTASSSCMQSHQLPLSRPFLGSTAADELSEDELWRGVCGSFRGWVCEFIGQEVPLVINDLNWQVPLWLVWLDRVLAAALNCVVHAWSRYKYLKWDQESHPHPSHNCQMPSHEPFALCRGTTTFWSTWWDSGAWTWTAPVPRQATRELSADLPAQLHQQCAVCSVCRVDSKMCPQNS